MKSSLLFGLSTAFGLTTLVIAGCGGSNNPLPVPTPTPSALPSVPGVVPTPGPAGPVIANDFGFASTVGSNRTSGLPIGVFGSDGMASLPFVLQSVNGFLSPITFPYTVTVTGPPTSTGPGATLDSSLVSVSVNPSPLTLQAGNSTVTLSVKENGTLAPLSRVEVALHAEGGGLQRYPTVGAYDNSGTYTFIAPGVSTPSLNLNSFQFSGFTGQKATGGVSFEAYGFTGNASVQITGLPTGATASFDPATIPLVAVPTDTFSGGSYSTSVTITANQTLPSGTYPIRAVVTVNGVTYTSDPTNLVVGTVSFY